MFVAKKYVYLYCTCSKFKNIDVFYTYDRDVANVFVY